MLKICLLDFNRKFYIKYFNYFKNYFEIKLNIIYNYINKIYFLN